METLKVARQVSSFDSNCQILGLSCFLFYFTCFAEARADGASCEILNKVLRGAYHTQYLWVWNPRV